MTNSYPPSKKASHGEYKVPHSFYCALTSSGTIKNFIIAILSAIYNDGLELCRNNWFLVHVTIEWLRFGALLRKSHISNL